MCIAGTNTQSLLSTKGHLRYEQVFCYKDNMDKIEIALATDLIQICEEAGAQFHKVYGGGYRSHCPLHRGDGENNFAIYHDAGKLKWKCYSNDCGQGDVIDFVIIWKNTDLKGAIEYLAGGKTLTIEDAAKLSTERTERAEQHKNQKAQEYKDALEDLWRAKAWESYYHNLIDNDKARGLWRDRGVPDVFQDIWQLGYCNDFIYRTNQGNATSASLVIPIYQIGKDDPINIRHRLLYPLNPTDKYRPERRGLKSAPFIADKDNEHERVLIVEGEIKAMVTYIELDDTGLQIYGIPGKNNIGDLTSQLEGKDVYILLDPDAETEAIDTARAVRGKVINLQIKVDDAIIAGYLDAAEIRRMMKSARRY